MCAVRAQYTLTHTLQHKINYKNIVEKNANYTQNHTLLRNNPYICKILTYAQTQQRGNIKCRIKIKGIRLKSVNKVWILFRVNLHQSIIDALFMVV